MKKALSLLLAFALTASCAVGALAEDSGIQISVSGPLSEEAVVETYNADAEIATGESAEPFVLLPAIEDYTGYGEEAIRAEYDALIASLEAQSVAEQSVDTVGEETVDANLDSYTKDVSGFVDRMYELVLNRGADPTGKADWVSGLKSGKYKGADIVFGFFASTEYQGRNRSNDQMVTDAYNAILGRTPDASGKAYWLEGLGCGMTTIGIANGFVGSQEFIRLCASYGITSGSLPMARVEWRDRSLGITRFVSRFYTKCLGRAYDKDGLNNWCGALLTGSVNGASVASQFVFSTEYKNKHATNTDYIVMLYSTFFDRAPDIEGLLNWHNKLDYTNSREFVLNGFLGSNEFATLCKNAGVAIGGSVTTPESTTAWQINVKLLGFINAQRGVKGLNYLTLRQDLYEVATLRVKELPTNNSEWRPNNKGGYQSAYADIGITNALEKYETRVSDTKSNSIEAIATALFDPKSVSSRAQLLSDTVNTYSCGYLYANSTSWYAIEVARIS